MTIIVWVLFGLFVNAYIGAAVFCLINKNGQFYLWYKDMPSLWLDFIVLELWFIVVAVFLKKGVRYE